MTPDEVVSPVEIATSVNMSYIQDVYSQQVPNTDLVGMSSRVEDLEPSYSEIDIKIKEIVKHVAIENYSLIDGK